MPRSKTKLEYNTFVKGLITEAGPLTFPDNASLVDTNYVLNTDGSRQRRLGVDYEPGYSTKTLTSIEGVDTAVGSYTWKSVNNDGELDIAVLQIGNNLYFYDNNVTPITGSPLNGGVAKVVGTVSNIKFSFTESYGKLVVATRDEEVTVLKYDKTSDTISDAISPFRLKIRDTFGVQEVPDIASDFRPTTLSNSHQYNLRNQGWVDSFKCGTGTSGQVAPTITDTIPYTLSAVGFYPSNADSLALSLYSSALVISCINAYSPHELKKSILGSTETSRGSEVIDVFNRGTSRNLVSSGNPNDETVGGISSVVTYAGRVFYSVKVDSTNNTDDKTPDIGSMVFFSQNTTNIADINKCYSKNDPTALEFNDPLDTDGGFINIPDSGEIYALHTLGKSLFVISSRGVWEISGGRDSYFSATNQSISKIADFGAYNSSSVVTGESLISFWSTGGIYSISLNESLVPTLNNITQNTIQELYDDIDFGAKSYVVGTYDDISKQVRWLYRDGPLSSDYYYNRELVFDLNLKAFYVNEFQELTMTSGSSPYIIGYIDLSSAVFTDNTEVVEVGTGNTVQVLGTDVQTSIRESDQTTKGSTKFWAIRDLGTGNADFTVAGFYDLDFNDWTENTDSLGVAGKDAEAVLLTGYTTDGDSEIVKKSKYITVFMKRTETGFTDDGSGNLTPVGESSCKLQGQWEWTNSAAAGRWSNESEVYRLPRAYTPTGSSDPFDYSFTVVKTKNKIRGKGSSLSLLFKSSPGKDLHLYGWSREVTVPAD